jgi:hypothetical protein
LALSQYRQAFSEAEHAKNNLLDVFPLAYFVYAQYPPLSTRWSFPSVPFPSSTLRERNRKSRSLSVAEGNRRPITQPKVAKIVQVLEEIQQQAAA